MGAWEEYGLQLRTGARKAGGKAASYKDFHGPLLSPSQRRGLIEANDGCKDSADRRSPFPRRRDGASLKQLDLQGPNCAGHALSPSQRRGLIEARLRPRVLTPAACLSPSQRRGLIEAL